MDPENGNRKRPVTMDHLRSKKQPTIRKVRLSMSSDVDERLNQAESEFTLAQVQLMADDEDEELKVKADQTKFALKAAQDAAMEDSVEFVFRSMGRKQYDALVDEHPPSEASRKDALKQGGNPDQLPWDPYTFPPALLAASIVSPALTHEDIMELWESNDWSGNEMSELFSAALEAQQARRLVQLGNG